MAFISPFFHPTHRFRQSVANPRLRVLADTLIEYALMRRARSLAKSPLNRPKYVHSCDFIGACINTEGYYEKPYIDFVRTSVLPRLNARPRCLVDIGANIGNHSLCLGVDFEKVISIEPAQVNFELLKLNCRDPKFTLHNIALSSKRGEAIIAIDSVNKGASRLEPLHSSRGIMNTHEELIQTTTLDSLLFSEPAVDVIKVDVEGLEYDVLIGATEILQKFEPIILFEQNSWDVKGSSQSAATLLSRLGYRFILLSGASLHEPGSKLDKLSRLLRLLILGQSIQVEWVDLVPDQNTYPVVVAYKPG
jgi:FkbM family methyltransferase